MIPGDTTFIEKIHTSQQPPPIYNRMYSPLLQTRIKSANTHIDVAIRAVAIDNYDILLRKIMNN